LWYKYWHMSTQTVATTDLASETELLRAENSSLKQLIESLQQKCATLNEQVEWFKRQIFGVRSERNVDPFMRKCLTFPVLCILKSK